MTSPIAPSRGVGDAKSQSVGQPAQGLEPRAAFEARLAEMLREGLPQRAASLFVQRVLGPVAMPHDCAGLLHRLATASGEHTLTAWLAGRDADGFAISPATLERFCEAIGAEGRALLSSQTDHRAQDHARAVLGAAYEIQADQLAPAHCMSWRKDRVLRPWYEALASNLPEAAPLPAPATGSETPPAASPWPMRDPLPLLSLARLLGNRTLTYPVLQATLMASAPREVLAPPPLAFGDSGLLATQREAGAALVRHVHERARRSFEGGISPLQVIALVRAGADGVEAIGAPASAADSHGIYKSAQEATKAMASIFPDLMHLSAVENVFFQLRSKFQQSPLYMSSQLLAGDVRSPHRAMLEGIEMWDWRAETLAWFSRAMPELRARDIIRERQALFALLHPGPGPGTGLEPSPGAALEERSGAEALRYKRGFAIKAFYSGFVEAVKPAQQHLLALRGPGQPVGLRQLGEPLLVPRLAMHAGVARHEIGWLETYADGHPELAEEMTVARAALESLANDLVDAIGDTRAWPAWVAESMRATEREARATASGLAAFNPGVIPPGGRSGGPAAAAAPTPATATRPSDSLVSPARK